MSFTGHRVCVTGNLRSMTRFQAGLEIEKRGGHVDSSVRKTTTLLVAKGYPNGRRTSKVIAAEKACIPIITDYLFRRILTGLMTVLEAINDQRASMSLPPIAEVDNTPRKRSDAGRTSQKAKTKASNTLIAASAKKVADSEFGLGF